MGLPDPLAIVGLATGVIGSGIQAIGALQQSKAQSAQAAYQAQVSRNNAQIAQQNAELATQTGQAKAEATSLTNRETMGRLIANQAASGLDVNTGSPVDVRATHRELGNLATQTDVYNAALQNYGYRSQAASYQAEAGLQRAQAQSAAAAGPLAATGSLLGGAGSAASKYLWMQTNFGGTGVGAGAGAAGPFFDDTNL